MNSACANKTSKTCINVINSGSIFIFVFKALRVKSKRDIMKKSDATCQYAGKLRKIKLLVSFFEYLGIMTSDV